MEAQIYITYKQSDWSITDTVENWINSIGRDEFDKLVSITEVKVDNRIGAPYLCWTT